MDEENRLLICINRALSFISYYSSNIKNQDFSPYCFLSEFLKDYIDEKYYSYSKLPNEIIANINNTLCSEQFYNDNINDSTISLLSKDKLFDDGRNHSIYSVNSRNYFFFKNLSINDHMHTTFIYLAKRIENALKKMPISTSSFPRYMSTTNESNKPDLTLLSQILDQSTNQNNNQENAQTSYKQEDLIQFHDILCKYPKPFSFSVSFVLSVIEKFTNFLKGLQKTENLNIEDDEFKCYRLTLLILLRLYMMIQQMPNFITVLIELISLEEAHPNLEKDAHFSYKNTVQQILPECLTKRSVIIKNVSKDQILDFYFSHDDENNFILTNEGVFKIKDLNKCHQIEFNGLNKIPINFNSADFNKEGSKITFSNGILYLFCDNKIHKASVSKNEEEILKEDKIKQKQDKAKEHSQIKHKPKKDSNKKEKKKVPKNTSKKIREKEKKEKRNKRKMDRFIIEEKELNLESVKIDLPDFPVIAVGSYNNFIRIVQRKSSNDSEKVSLILTNVNLEPNDSINYNIEEVFTEPEKELKSIQTQVEIELTNQFNNVFFSEDFMFISYESSLIEQYIIYNDGKIDLFKPNISPLTSFSNTIFKMDEKSFLYSFEHIQNNDTHGISISKFYLPETRYCLNEDKVIFLKYPFLQKLSSIVTNCSQIILNREDVKENITVDEAVAASRKNYRKIEIEVKSLIKYPQYKLKVSPEEMGCLIQPTSSFAPQLENTLASIKSLKDEKLKQFFITLLMKLCGVNLYYDMVRNFNVNYEDFVINYMNLTKKFVVDLYSLLPESESNIYNNMLQESTIFTLSVGAKLLFLPDSYDELHDFMDKVLQNQTENTENIKFISPYFDVLFEYIEYVLRNKTFVLAEYILSILICIESNSYSRSTNPYLALILEQKLIELNSLVYNKIHDIPGIVEFDDNFLKYSSNLDDYEVHTEKCIIESKHPYNLEFINDKEEEEEENKSNKKTSEGKKYIYKKKKQIKIYLGTVNFKDDVDYVFYKIDKNTNLSINDVIMLSSNQIINSCYYNDERYIPVKATKKFDVFLIRNYGQDPLDNQNEILLNNMPHWGCKYIFYGVKTNKHQYKYFNNHLFFYNKYISFLITQFNDATYSIPLLKSESDFKLILNDKIIQGIKLEDIDKYESEMNDNNNNSIGRTISRGISRGISYDYNENSHFEEKKKKDFLNQIINVKEDSNSSYKRFLDVIYQKTAKKNRIKLIGQSKVILEAEHYLSACLFKHLGLISLCMEFMKILNCTKKDELDNIEVPILITSIWIEIYALRKLLFFEYQKSKSIANTEPNSEQSKNHFIEYLEEIKSKCKLLLYSIPILKFNDKEEERDNNNNNNNDNNNSNNENENAKKNTKFDLAVKSIYSFVISKIPLSNISQFIDIRRKRLSISKKALSLFSSFIDQNLFFNITKRTISDNYANCTSLNACIGVKDNEIKECKDILNSLSSNIFQIILTNPSILTVLRENFMTNILYSIDDDALLSEKATLIINMINENESNESFYQDSIAFNLIRFIISIALKTKDNKIVQFLVKCLQSEKYDSQIKQVILMMFPILAKLIPNNETLNNEKIAFSILEENKNSPIIVSSIFYWLAVLINNSENDHQEFILKVLKGIGQSFYGKSCLFIDDSFPPFSHKQVSQTMISFIIMLFNMKNENLLTILHDILTKMINKIDFEEESDEMNLSIGMFASLGQCLSAFEPNRKIFINDKYDPIVCRVFGYNESNDTIENEINDAYPCGFFFNDIDKIDNNLYFDEIEVDNILNLHEKIMHSKYFADKPNYDYNIEQKEIAESVLISTFYSFLSIFIQNKNNASILLNEDNLKRTLSLFEMANLEIPTYENSIQHLSHYLEKSIFDQVYNYTPTNENEILLNNSIRFIRMNYGEVIYNDNKNDLIKSNENYYNVFCCNRPFDSKIETYYEVKINKIGSKNVLIGFIDSEEESSNKAFGFGCIGYNYIFCRKSPYLNEELVEVTDYAVIKEHQQANDNSNNNIKLDIHEGDRIGCYYTSDFVYLIINGVLTPYRLSHASLKSYIPIICIYKDDIELEILQNVSFVDHSNEKYDFLNINNLPKDYFDEKDINKLLKKKSRYENFDEILNGEFLIGSIARTSIINENISCLNSFKYPKSLLKYYHHNEIIKDIIPVKDNDLLKKAKIESYNTTTLCKEIIDVDVENRYFMCDQTNFFNIIENRTNTKFGFNTKFDVKSLPNELQTSPDLSKIRNYMKNKTIKDNSKSIAIIMSRYLSFIMIDYLRYSKSKLLQDEGINSKEADCIIKSLSHSLPTITLFIPCFYRPRFMYINVFNIRQTIFVDDIEEQNSDDRNNKISKNLISYFNTGFSSYFNLLFKFFLKQSERFLSPLFISKLLHELFEIANNNNTISSSLLYDLIPSNQKIESISPLPNINFENEYTINIHKYFKNQRQLEIGSIPILIKSIPDKMPCAFFGDRGFRISSDKVSYFKFHDDQFSLNWKYVNKKDDEKIQNVNENKNYKLQFGIFPIKTDLQEFLLNGPLGYIQILFLIFRSLLNSEFLFNKHQDLLNQTILDNVITLSLQRNPLVYPFLKHFIILISSSSGFSDDLLSKKAAESFSILSESSNILYPINQYPSHLNELPLIFSLYYNLIDIRNAELSIKNADRDEISNLFEKYYLINNELFKLDSSNNNSKFAEGAKQRRYVYDSQNFKKNYRMFYLEYYYSILLDNENHFPYPKFLYFNDRIRQHFGGFRFAISRGDIINYAEKNGVIKHDNNNNNNNNFDNEDNNQVQKVFYKSDILNNDVDLECSCTLFSILEAESNQYVTNNVIGRFNQMLPNDNQGKNSKAYKVIAHQLNDDKQIELPQTGENIRVSFPLEILVYKEEDGKEKLEVGEAFIINFSPSKDQQLNYFVDHYDQLQKEFDQFMSLSEHDNELSSLIFKPKEDESNSKEEDFNDINENEAETQNGQEEADEFLRMLRPYRSRNKKVKVSRKDFNLFELEKIPTKVSFQQQPLNISESILSLRCSIQLTYNDLAEKIMVYYSKSDKKDYYNDDDYWAISLPSTSSKLQNLFEQQIIRPAHSMSTKLKFNFINKILKNEKQGEIKIKLVINRFEQQRFFEQFDLKSRESSSNSSARPMIVQFIEQVDSDSLQLLKVHRQNPFTITLVGEGAIDASGPGREIFSSLIVELMNEHIGIFTFNPNRRHKTKDTNQEDLIPNIHYDGKIYKEVTSKKMFSLTNRFVYAGAFIAVCIVSEIPQQMKLAYFVWEYLSCEKVSIESIYEIDHDFHEIMKTAESLQKQIKEDYSSISEDEFESKFMKTFEIKNSFDKNVSLVANGSDKKVTKDNLSEFIELAKKNRIHEFDVALKLLKIGFDLIMQYKNITSILTPSELKLFICGEPNCSVEQMKQLTVVSAPNEQMIKMFWNVIESFSLEERILFIKFSTGSQGLPAPGMRWETDLQVRILTKEQFLIDGKILPEAHTCFSQIDIPYFETENDLARNLRVSINFSGVITDTGINENGIQQMT